MTKAPCWNIRDCIHCSRSCFSQGGTTPADAKFFGAFKKEACSPRALALDLVLPIARALFFVTWADVASGLIRSGGQIT